MLAFQMIQHLTPYALHVDFARFDAEEIILDELAGALGQIANDDTSRPIVRYRGWPVPTVPSEAMCDFALSPIANRATIH